MATSFSLPLVGGADFDRDPVGSHSASTGPTNSLSNAAAHTPSISAGVFARLAAQIIWRSIGGGADGGRGA